MLGLNVSKKGVSERTETCREGPQEKMGKTDRRRKKICRSPLFNNGKKVHQGNRHLHFLVNDRVELRKKETVQVSRRKNTNGRYAACNRIASRKECDVQGRRQNGEGGSVRVGGKETPRKTPVVAAGGGVRILRQC